MVLIGLLGLCVGALIGLGIDFKINHTYVKVYEKPIWRKTEEELPPCSGLYYGKIKGNPYGENSMWEVVYKDDEWCLAGSPDNKVEIGEWTEIY